MVGPEEIMPEFVLTGGHGGVNGGANLFPKLYVDLYNASVAKDFEKIEFLRDKVLQISTSIYNVGNYGSSYLKGFKMCPVGERNLPMILWLSHFTDLRKKNAIK